METLSGDIALARNGSLTFGGSGVACGGSFNLERGGKEKKEVKVPTTATLTKPLLLGLPPGRKESCRRGGESPAAGEVRVLPPGRKESCHRGGKSPGRKESCHRGGKSPGRVLPPGRKESCRRGGESPAAGEERVLPPGR